MTHPGPDPTEEPVAPDGTEPTATQESPRRSGRRGLTMGIVVAVVVLIGAGIGTWVAVGHAGATGSTSPEQAAEHLLSDVGNDDLLGVVNDLPPTEASLVGTGFNDATNHLKRIGVVKSGVSPQHAAGLTLRTSGIRFDSSAVQQVNDHIAITKLVAGTITIGSKLSADNYTANFLRTAFPQGLANTGGSTTVNIAQEAQRLGHPVRIATVKVNDRWYPSLFYSIADSVLQNLHQPWPTAAIPAIGADIPAEAAEDFLQAVLNGDPKLAIEHTQPTEAAVLHDMGQALVDSVHTNPADHVRIIRVAFDNRHVPGGIEAVVKRMSFVAHGQTYVLQRTVGCYTLQAGKGKPASLCQGDIANQLRSDPVTRDLPRPVVNLVNEMFTGLAGNGIGFVTTENRQSWYVNPAMTVDQVARDLYGNVKEQDLASTLRLMSQAQ